MPLTLAFTDSLGYATQADAEAAGYAIAPGSGRVSSSFGELHTVDGQSPSILVTVDGGQGGTTFSMTRSFEMAPNSLCGASVAEDRIGAPWYEDLVVVISTGLETKQLEARFGLVTATTDGTGAVTITIYKDPGYPYVHDNERYYFANLRLYGDLVGDLPPGLPPAVLPVLLFTPEMNWEEPFVETLECETAITSFYGDVEAREGLSSEPNQQLSYLITSGEPKEAGLLEALIMAGQAREWWAPYWRSAEWLAAPVSAGQTTLAIDTRHKGYDPNYGVMFWRDAFHAEVVDLISVTDSLLTFAPTVSAWAASGPNRAKVMPAYRGLLAPSEDLDYPERSMKQTHLTFDILP